MIAGVRPSQVKAVGACSSTSAPQALHSTSPGTPTLQPVPSEAWSRANINWNPSCRNQRGHGRGGVRAGVRAVDGVEGNRVCVEQGDARGGVGESDCN